MSAFRSLALACALAFVALAPQAHAQRVATREAGAVELAFAPWSEAIEPRTVRPGEVAWEEALVIPDAVRLLKDVPERVRPGALEARAGSVLYGYQLSNGTAYCAPFDLRGSYVQQVQCFRDFNNDGMFDGAYVAQSLHRSTRAFPRHVYGLVGQRGAITYAPIESQDAPRIAARVIFERMSDGAPRLRLDTHDHVGGDEAVCEPVSADMCDWYGVRVQFAAQADGSVQIQPVVINDGRGFRVRMTDAR